MDFYFDPESTPCRAVLLVANALECELNLKSLDKEGEFKEERKETDDESNGENLEEIHEETQEYVEKQGNDENLKEGEGSKEESSLENLNDTEEKPEESKEIVESESAEKLSEKKEVPKFYYTPTLVDENFELTDLKTIVMYLADQYGKDDTLYPEDPELRALINQRIFFDITLFSHFLNHFTPNLFKNITSSPKFYSSIDSSFEVLDKFLDGEEYVAGDFLTIADLVLVTTVSTYEAIGVDIEKYPNVWKWYENLMEIMPGVNIHKAGVVAFLAEVCKDAD